MKVLCCAAGILNLADHNWVEQSPITRRGGIRSHLTPGVPMILIGIPPRIRTLTCTFGVCCAAVDTRGIYLADSIGFEPMRHFRNDGLANRSLNHSGNYPYRDRLHTWLTFAWEPSITSKSSLWYPRKVTLLRLPVISRMLYFCATRILSCLLLNPRFDLQCYIAK